LESEIRGVYSITKELKSDDRMWKSLWLKHILDMDIKSKRITEFLLFIK
jgi:hypothetical protein